MAAGIRCHLKTISRTTESLSLAILDTPRQICSLCIELFQGPGAKCSPASVCKEELLTSRLHHRATHFVDVFDRHLSIRHCSIVSVESDFRIDFQLNLQLTILLKGGARVSETGDFLWRSKGLASQLSSPSDSDPASGDTLPRSVKHS